jgi:hypothetical protein
LTNPGIFKGFLFRKLNGYLSDSTNQRPLIQTIIKTEPVEKERRIKIGSQGKLFKTYDNFYKASHSDNESLPYFESDKELFNKIGVEIKSHKIYNSSIPWTKLEKDFNLNRTLLKTNKIYDLNPDVAKYFKQIRESIESHIKNKKANFKKLKMMTTNDFKNESKIKNEGNSKSQNKNFNFYNPPRVYELTKYDKSRLQSIKNHNMMNKARDNSISKVMYRLYPKEQVDSKIGKN